MIFVYALFTILPKNIPQEVRKAVVMVVNINDVFKLAQTSGRLPVELYELRSNGSTLCTRLIQIRTDASMLNSAFW